MERKGLIGLFIIFRAIWKFLAKQNMDKKILRRAAPEVNRGFLRGADGAKEPLSQNA